MLLHEDEVGVSRPRPADEEGHRWNGEQRVQRWQWRRGVGDRQWRDAQRLFPTYSERHPTGDQQRQARTGHQQVGNGEGGGREHLLDVVQHHHLAPLREHFGYALHCGAPADVQQTERSRDRAGYQVGVADGSEVNQRDAVGEAVTVFVGVFGEASRCGKCQARLADASRADERKQPSVPRGQ